MFRSLTIPGQLGRIGWAAGVLLFLPSFTFAWGPKAHRIIAGLAWQQLQSYPETKRKVEELLGKGANGNDPLTAIATWADEQGLKNPKTRAWHFVDIPLNASTYDQKRDCPTNNCLVEAVKQLKNQLQFGRTRQERIDALKYLVHLVGDLHQPLHCADNNDQGGNRVQVTFFGKTTNLHSVWDSEMIERTPLSDDVYVKKLMSALPSEGYWIEDWANESHALAKYAYQIPRDRALSNSYYQANLPLVDRQLARASVRLVQILNIALK